MVFSGYSICMIELTLLFLLIVANGAPVIAKKILADKWAFPLDANLTFVDGHPLFGRAKTVRGVVFSCLLTVFVSLFLNVTVLQALLIALFAMLGDLFSSFIKRRAGMKSSSMAIGLDQVPESLFPLLVLKSQLALSWQSVLVIVALFFVCELALSVILYRLNIRSRPY